MTAPFILLPSKPDSPNASGVVSQRSRRFTDTLFDTHRSARFPRGRPFTGEREYAATPELGHQPGFVSGLQCAEYVTNEQGVMDRQATLTSAWNAPWLPLEKYFKFNYQRKLITYDWLRAEADEREGLQRYYQAAAKLAGANGWGEITFNVVPKFQVTSIIGMPTPYLPVVQAARAGDPWLWGDIDEPNDELAKILGHQVLFVDGGRGGLATTSVPKEAPAVQPIVTPAQILAAPSIEDMMKLVAAAVAAAMEARDAKDREKKQKDAAKMAKARAGRKVTNVPLVPVETP